MSKDKAYCLAKYKEDNPPWIIVNKFFDIQNDSKGTDYRSHFEESNPPLDLENWSVVMHEELVQW